VEGAAHTNFCDRLVVRRKKNMSPPKGSSHNETGQRSVQLTLYKTKRKWKKNSHKITHGVKPPDHKSVTKVCMCSSFHILIENSIKLCMFAFYHIDNCISLWHFNWTIFEGVIYLEYFIKMGGGRNKCFRSNQFLILCYSQTSLCQNWRDKCFYLEIVV
jgi:hypothetical protein